MDTRETNIGDYLIKLYPVNPSLVAVNGIGTVAGRLRLMAALVTETNQDSDRRIGANLCYQSTADWLLAHKEQWEGLNLVILAMQPTVAMMVAQTIHTLVTNRDNSSIVYDLDNALCKKPIVVNGYFLPVSELKNLAKGAADE